MLGVARSLARGARPLAGGSRFHAQNGNAPSASLGGGRSPVRTAWRPGPSRPRLMPSLETWQWLSAAAS